MSKTYRRNAEDTRNQQVERLNKMRNVQTRKYTRRAKEQLREVAFDRLVVR